MDKEESIQEKAMRQPDFIPANYISRVVYEEGRYKTLLSPLTHAVWVDENISKVKLAYEQQQDKNGSVDEGLVQDASFIAEHFIVIECHIETTLPDASVAYDVSSLRNLDVYLKTSSGSVVYPLQHVIASKVEEKRTGALTQFYRQNYLVFAKKDIITGKETIPVDATQLRVYIEGFGTKYYFEWKPQTPIVVEAVEGAPPQDITDVIQWRPNQTETVQVLRVRFSELYTTLHALTRLPQHE